jgi:hypothetical protein
LFQIHILDGCCWFGLTVAEKRQINTHLTHSLSNALSPAAVEALGGSIRPVGRFQVGPAWAAPCSGLPYSSNSRARLVC